MQRFSILTDQHRNQIRIVWHPWPVNDYWQFFGGRKKVWYKPQLAPLHLVDSKALSAVVNQTSLLPSTLNRITFSFTWASVLPQNSELFIHGLTGASLPTGSLGASGQLSLVNSDGNFVAMWDAKSESVILKIKPECVDNDPQDLSQATNIVVLAARCSLAANTRYTVMFYLRNPSITQQSPDVRFSARVMPFQPNEATLRGGNSDTLAYERSETGPVTVSKASETLMGITAGTDPMYVLEPKFTMTDIGQSSSYYGIDCSKQGDWCAQIVQKNLLTMKIRLNVDLQKHSKITLTGLTGTNTPSTDTFAIESTGKVFGSIAHWTQNTGTLVLTCSSPVPIQTPITIEVQFLNSFLAQKSPDVFVSGLAVVDPQNPVTCFVTQSVCAWTHAVMPKFRTCDILMRYSL